MQATAEILAHLEHIAYDLEQVRNKLIGAEPSTSDSDSTAWKELSRLSRSVSKEWKGPDAVEEIRQQREKAW